MGVPDRPSPGKHGLAGSAMPVAKGSQGMECLPLKIYPDLPKQPRPCLSPEDEEEKDKDAEKPGLSSFRKYLSKTKRSAPPQNARHLPLGCRPFDDCLSRRTLQETETFEEGEEDLKPSFTF